jgi:5-formyltetrahydrofolate cyclo-ligase
MDDAKTRLRKEMLARRRALTPDQVRQRSFAAVERVRALDEFSRAAEVLAYMAFDNEVETAGLVAELWGRGARVLLPRCLPGRPGEMELACPTGPSQLTAGAYGIPEPDPGVCPGVEDFSPDLALIPGLAFDRLGRRLGFGKGYYDRLLACGMGSALLVGLAYDFQVVDRLPAAPHDAPVHMIASDTETIRVTP